MLQGFAGGAIVDPVLLILVQVQQAFQHRHQNSETGDNILEVERRQVKRSEKRNQRGRNNLCDLDALKHPLVKQALAVIPIDLIFQAGQ